MSPMQRPMKQKQPAPDDAVILSLTKKGERELREPGTTLPPNLLEALVLVDGHSTAGQVIRRAGNQPPEVLRAYLNELIAKNFVMVATGPADESIDPGDFFSPGSAQTVPAEEADLIQARSEADAEFLRRYGYFVNMAHRPSVTRERGEGRKPTALIIEDDPDICKVLQVCLKLEDIETRAAVNRDEAVAELRRIPLPDLVLLDIRLPDVNGFDILAKIRKHDALKGLPVIIMTAEATRDAVLRGILGGADGFITKPFQIHPLIKTVKTVLGLKQDTDL